VCDAVCAITMELTVEKQKIQELLHECKTAMTLKELESRASKDYGVVSQSVKEIVDELIADGLVW
jgi:hypothetical protein